MTNDSSSVVMEEKRYYYDDPLAAAWMAKYFGMSLEYTYKTGGHETSNWHLTFCKHVVDGTNYRFSEIANNTKQKIIDKYYITAESLPILEPQVGDVVQHYSGIIGVIEHAEFPFIWRFNWFNDVLLDDNYKIIQRGGLVFHWPKQE